AKERADGLRKAFLSGEGFEEVEKRVVAVEEAGEDKASRLFTADQRKALEELLGAPFLGRVELPRERLGGASAAETPAGRYFGLYHHELGYLTEKPIQEELKCTEAQAAKAAAAWKRWNEKSAEGAALGPTALTELSKLSAQELADILTPDQ